MRRLPRRKACGAWPAENPQSIWKRVKRAAEPMLIAINPTSYRNDVAVLLRALGCSIYDVSFLALRISNSPFIVCDGRAATYRVGLKVDGKTVDETELKVPSRLLLYVKA